MIAYDFIYVQPDTLRQARENFLRLSESGQNPVYYAGGSEIITMCRAGDIRPGAVIDIKNIDACQALSLDEDWLRLGAACTLNRIKESGLFPLLGLVCGRIADHTNQCRITLGGNLCGSIIYRETSLPLLLADAKLILYGARGRRALALKSVFDGRMRLQPDELIVEAQVPLWALNAPYYHMKKTANEKIDYPLLSVAALLYEDQLRVACSGLADRPLRSKQVEVALNRRALSPGTVAAKATALLAEQARDSVEGSAAYRLFVLENTLRSLVEDWHDEKI